MSKKIPSVLDRVQPIGFDPWAEDLTLEQKAEVISRCRNDILSDRA